MIASVLVPGFHRIEVSESCQRKDCAPIRAHDFQIARDGSIERICSTCQQTSFRLWPVNEQQDDEWPFGL